MQIQFLSSLAMLFASSLAAPQHGGEPGMRLNQKTTTAELVGDGSPRQAYLYKQVTVCTSEQKANDLPED